MDAQAYQAILDYHEQTKHSFQRFAKSLGYMDWKNQPHPFRFYQGQRQIVLPLLKKDPAAGHLDLYNRENNSSQPFTLPNVASLLELALGLSAWKAIAGNKWSLRVNPSSGNLHPTECHVVLPAMDTIPAGVYHYSAFSHVLEARAELHSGLWDKVRSHFGSDGFLVALSTIFWRESWKYGERAFRYCNHDIGHALACLSFSANLHGWKVKYLNALADETIATILGFDKVEWRPLEEEYAENLCFVHSNQGPEIPRGLPPDIISAFSQLSFGGTPNVLSRQRVPWPLIDDAASFSRKPTTTEKKIHYGREELRAEEGCPLSAPQIIRQRRSAVAFSGDNYLTRVQFLTILDRTRPRDDHSPFDIELIEPTIHLLLFVHSVHGLQQGLYLFLRNDQDLDELQNACRPQFLWQQVEEGFPLYFLEPGNFRQVAARVSCDQDIAGYGIFALAMIAKFAAVIEKEPYRYRHLFWEAGMIGQVLYLEAEAHGLRGTGIGCFFDDAVHDLLGLRSNAYQSLYHFTVGDPIDDTRLTTFPPYAHLQRA